MYKFLSILVLLASCLAQDDGGDPESIIKQLQNENNGQTENKNNGATAAPQSSTLVPSIFNNNNDDGDRLKSCLRADKVAGECVPFYLCGANDTIINDGVGIIDIRISRTKAESTKARPPSSPASSVSSPSSTGDKFATASDTSATSEERGPPPPRQPTRRGRPPLPARLGLAGQPAPPRAPAAGGFESRVVLGRTKGTTYESTMDQVLHIIRIELHFRVIDGECNYFETCCLLPDRKSPDNPIDPGHIRPISNTPAPPAKSREGCGWRNPDGVGFRITGAADGEANFGEFPWMVAVLRIEPVNENEPNGLKVNVYVGGGSLIHPSVVLTAAHVVAKGNKLRIRAGEWDTQTKNELYPYQARDVKEVFVHKDFNKGNLFYDIGLLFLASPVDAAPNVGVACLPNPGVRAASGTRCLASGWGKDNFGKKGRYQVILKRVEVPVIERARCQQELRKTRLAKYFELHTSFMCAGGEPGADTCEGDGGSPLVCPSKYQKHRYIQNGIVAWGIGCGEQTPAVYVDVGHLRSWIDDKVRGHGYDEKVYTYLD